MSKVTKKDKIIKWFNKGLYPNDVVRKGYSPSQVYPLFNKFKESLIVTDSEKVIAKKLGISPVDYAIHKDNLAKETENRKLKTTAKAKAWAKANKWFGVDEEMTAKALAYHEHLIKQGVDPNSDEYYKLVDAHMKPKDLINSPDHYTAGGIETIDFIEAKEVNYHVGNAIKYLSRAKHKGDYLENIKKAQWYINREVSRHEKDA